MIETVWLCTPDNQAVARWIDDNLIDTTYEISGRVIIVTVRDADDWCAFRLAWCY